MQLAEKRAKIAAEKIPAGYPGYLHFGGINLAALVTIGLCVALLSAREWWMLAWVPGFFLFANLFEHWVHKGPMHHKRAGRVASALYERHARQHHVMFTHDSMEIRASQELRLVLFPWWMFPVMLLGTSPIPLGLAYFVSPDHGLLFVASVVAYYLVYEWLHTLHHWPQETWIGRRRVVGWLRAHHMRHHDPALMAKGNFNVSFPLADWILGTTLDQPAAQGTQGSSS